MNRPTAATDLPVGRAADLLDEDLVPLLPLLDEPCAGAWPLPSAEQPPTQALRQRLLQRASASRAAEQSMVTSRQRRLAAQGLAPGVRARILYTATPGTGPRPGEPQRARWIEMAAGATLPAAALGDPVEMRTRHREWLVVRGSLALGGEQLGQRDYHVTPIGHATPDAVSLDGAVLFLREAVGVDTSEAPFTVRDSQAGWPEFAPGIRRRVLWQHAGQAALLYHADPGAQVPQHSHGHDEECLMLQGELFLDDVLLQSGDYQLAPAGSGHRLTYSDTGVVIYAHGDLELRFT